MATIAPVEVDTIAHFPAAELETAAELIPQRIPLIIDLDGPTSSSTEILPDLGRQILNFLNPRRETAWSYSREGFQSFNLQGEHFDGIMPAFVQLHRLVTDDVGNEITIRRYQLTAEQREPFVREAAVTASRRHPSALFNQAKLNRMGCEPKGFMLVKTWKAQAFRDQVLVFPNGFDPESDTFLDTHEFTTIAPNGTHIEGERRAEIGIIKRFFPKI